MTLSALISEWREIATNLRKSSTFCYESQNFDHCARELERAATAIESEHAALVAERDALVMALSNIVANARLEADTQMEGATDCYAVPLEDMDVARYLTEKQP